MPRLIWVFVGRTVILLVLSWRGSNEKHVSPPPPPDTCDCRPDEKHSPILQNQRETMNDWNHADGARNLHIVKRNDEQNLTAQLMKTIKELQARIEELEEELEAERQQRHPWKPRRKRIKWTASSEFGTYRLSAQSRQNLHCSLIQAVSQEEPSDRKPDPWPLWMAGHAQLKFVMTECSKTQIRLTGLKWNCILFQFCSSFDYRLSAILWIKTYFSYTNLT